MLFEGCQGKKGPQIQEKICPNCGNPVELMSTDVSVRCEECGFTVYSDLMECIHRCAGAKDCVGEEQYRKFMAAKAEWEEYLQSLQSDEW